MKVMKFGGACLKNMRDFQEVAGIICAEEKIPVVVVSAVSGVTDLLESGIQIAAKSDKKVPEILKDIRGKHESILKGFIRNNNDWLEIKNIFEAKLNRLERLFYGVSFTEEISNSVKALILSYGERLSALTTSSILRLSGRKALAVDSDEITIVTDDSFWNATAILPEVKKNFQFKILPLIKRKIIPVITGYFGCTEEGKVTTFGKNGSDYTASVIAYSAGADLLEIWKDVDGLMSADPKIVENSHRIDRLSYYEAAEISYFGAKVLHPRTVEPLVNVSIPMRIRNLYEKGSEGTEILPIAYEKEHVIKCVTCNEHISLLKILGPGVGYKPGIIAKIGHILSDIGINIYSVLTSQTCINLLVNSDDSQRSYEALKRASGGIIADVKLENDISLIGVVGEGLLRRKGVYARIFSAVAEEKVNIEMISSGASEVASYFIVKKDDVKKTIHAIHREFF